MDQDGAQELADEKPFDVYKKEPHKDDSGPRQGCDNAGGLWGWNSPLHQQNPTDEDDAVEQAEPTPLEVPQEQPQTQTNEEDGVLSKLKAQQLRLEAELDYQRELIHKFESQRKT